MRILLAIDGSRSADVARDLVATLPWPTGSSIRAVAAVPRHADPSVTAFIAVSTRTGERLPQVPDDQSTYTIDTALDAAVRDIERPGRTVERLVLRGKPGSAIVDEARDWNADLIVVGSRGHGPFESMLLGSVSAEVVDHAPCPVLVVRQSAVERIVFAEDGSPSAAHALEVLSGWPVFHAVPVTVLTVAEVDLPVASGMVPGLYDQVLESYSESVDEAIRECTSMATATAEQLRAAGYAAEAVVRQGDPAHEIVGAAGGSVPALVVMGTRGHRGLARLLLGSVARNVLHHAPGSVLVVREKATVRHEDADEAALARSAPRA